MKKISCIILLFISIILFLILFTSEVDASSIDKEEYANRLKVIKELFNEDNNQYNKKKEEANQIIRSLSSSNSSSSSKNHSSYTPTGRYVFITLDSSKYHEAGCDYLESRPYKVGLEWAQSNGYGPCKHCNPYGLYEDEKNFWINSNILITISIIFFIVIVIVFCIKKYSEKSIHAYKNPFNINNKPVNLDEYNISNVNSVEHEKSLHSNFNNSLKQEGNKLVNKQIENEKSKTKKKECILPMRWYNFYGFVKLPLGIVIAIIDLIIVISMSNQDPLMGILAFIIDIAQIIYMFYLMNVMDNKSENGFNCIIIWLVIETIAMGIKSTLNAIEPDTQTFIISTLIGSLIWFLPNYIYFNKRRFIFTTNKTEEK